jgi:hypothetical protein
MFSENSFMVVLLWKFREVSRRRGCAVWACMNVGESGERSSRGAHGRASFCWVGCEVATGVG